MEFPSTRGTRHGALVDEYSDHAASPAHAAGHADAGPGTAYAAGLRPSCPRLRRIPWASPDTATAGDIRRFQLHQHETGVSASTINSAVSALRFLFAVTLGRRDLSRTLVITRNPRKLPEVLSVEEAARLLAVGTGPQVQPAPSDGPRNPATQQPVRGNKSTPGPRQRHLPDRAAN